MLLKKFHVFITFFTALILLTLAGDTVVTSNQGEPKVKQAKIQSDEITQQLDIVEEEEMHIGVIILTDQTFDKRLKNLKKPWFIKIYAPWCGHCKRLAPIWDQLSHELQGKVNVAKVDATKQTEVSGRLDIRGYPTLLFTEDGKNFIQYRRQRTLESLSEFALGGYKNASQDDKSQISNGGKIAIFMLALARSFKELDKNIDAWLIEKGVISSPTSGYLKIGFFAMIFIIPFIFVGICSFFVFRKKDDEVLIQDAAPPSEAPNRPDGRKAKQQ